MAGTRSKYDQMIIETSNISTMIYEYIIIIILLRIQKTLPCSLSPLFIYIVASIPLESGRQPAILFSSLLVTVKFVELSWNLIWYIVDAGWY